LFSSFFLVTKVKSEFLPPEDRAQFNVNVEMPTGTSLEATEKVAEAVAADIKKNAPSVEHTLTTVGGGARGQVNLAKVQVTMTPSKTRPFSQQDLMAWVRARLGKASPDANITI